ncbi:MAG TPA: AAA family ATPase [Candidatus Limnocylindrales bacterium]|nr:AAA family ATPase [Candidatus Limnocylindrales bacterium]
MVQRVTSPVFIGREGELEELTEVIGRASAGIPSTVLVGGEAGIGKTRLLGELSARARSRNVLVLDGGCVAFGSDEALPFAPIATALRALVREVDRETLEALVDESTGELARLVPELGGTPDETPLATARPNWAQTRLFDGLLTLLGRLGERVPTILVVEDLHWADRSTRNILSFLARNARHERIALVGTYRTDELHRRHPLRPWLAEMDRMATVRRIELQRFDRDELRRQVEAILGEPPTYELVDSIARRSAGNPFFAEELVAAGHATPGDRVPEDLRDVLLGRIGSVSDRAQQMLGIAAVAGPAVTHDLLAAVADDDDADVTAAMREAVEANIVLPADIDGQPAYAFRHALVQEAVYDDLLPRERRGWHAGYVTALEAQLVPDGAAGASHLAALAHHASAAHDSRRALAAWIEAGRASARSYAMAESAQAFERALDLWDAVATDDQPSDIDVIQLMYEASMALIQAGDSARSAEVARNAVERFDASDDPLRAALLRERLARALWLSADLPGAIRVLDEAVKLLDGAEPSADVARVISGLAGTLMLKDQFTPAAAYAEQSVLMARDVGARDIEAYSLGTLGVAVTELGDEDLGIRLLRESMVMTKELTRAHDLHRVYSNLSTVLQDASRQEEAFELAMEGVQWAQRLGMWRLQGAFLEANAASALIELGRWDEAWQILDREGDPATEGVGRLNQAVTASALAIATGRVETARRLLHDVYEVVQRLRDTQFSGLMYVGLAELAMADDRLDDVRSVVAEGLERMSETEDVRRRPELITVGLRAEAVRAADARAHRRTGDLGDIRQVVSDQVAALRRLTDPAIARGGAVARLSAGFRLIGEAEAAGIDGEPQVDAWRQAVDHWRGLGQPFRVATCQYRFVQASLAIRGSRAEAIDALREAYAITIHLGAAPLRESIETLARLGRVDLIGETPDDVEAPGVEALGPAERPFGLTERELEVLRQLVGGRSNRQIGETLFISESTAGVHVSNILGKLGVTSRVEAAAIAVRSGLSE